MKTTRLNLSDFKLKVDQNKNETEISKLMGNVLGNCHDEPSVAPITTGGERYGHGSTTPTDVYVSDSE